MTEFVVRKTADSSVRVCKGPGQCDRVCCAQDSDISVRVCKGPGQCDRVCCAQDSGQFCEGMQGIGTV